MDGREIVLSMSVRERERERERCGGGDATKMLNKLFGRGKKGRREGREGRRRERENDRPIVRPTGRGRPTTRGHFQMQMKSEQSKEPTRGRRGETQQSVIDGGRMGRSLASNGNDVWANGFFAVISTF